MKRKIVLSLLVLFLFISVGATFAIMYIKNTTTTLGKLIQLHQIEDLRQHLIISIQTVQSDLYTVHTPLGQKLDLIADNVTTLDGASQKCVGCHHSPEVTREIGELRALITDYQKSLSYYITASANAQLIDKLKLDAAAIGNALLVKTAGMSSRAGSRLEGVTRDAMGKINKAWVILYATIGITFFFGIIVAVKLTASITGPIDKLVKAARMLGSGALGYTVPQEDKTEFGELASNFNTMSVALKESYAELEQEIGERIQTEAALVESEEFLNTIYNSIRDPFCIIGSNYQIVRANEAYALLKNAGLAELVGKTCYRVLEQRDRICDNCIVERTFLSGDSCAKEKAVVSGEMKSWVEIYTYPIENSDGKISHVIEYTRDITERKKAEEARRISEERYALAARGANDGLWDWDLTSNLIYYSYRWKSMLGYDEDDIGDRPDEWLGRVHPDDREQLEMKIAAHINGHSSHLESEYRARTKEGTYRWVLSRGLAVRSHKDGRVYRMAGSQTDIMARKTAEEQLLYDAFHDALTGLPNRALFMDRLNHVSLTSRRHPASRYAVLFLDIDRFKIVNDSMGHTIGDLMLVEVAKRLSMCLRPADTVARLGGDEFAVLLENITRVDDATDVAKRIQIELTHPIYIEGHELFTSASTGIALSGNPDGIPEHLLRDADIAMYQAKAKGDSGYEIFDTSMYANIVDRLQLEADLRRAVEHKEFLLHYQPIIDLKNQGLVGFEALVRWRHPERGLIYPLEFIPLAEETGLIFPLAEWTLWESCRQLKTWQVQYPACPPLKMSINISSRQFSRPDLISMLSSVIAEIGLAADCLALEITESMIMANMESAAVTMEKLRNMGVCIHIDDFGTGYSSLSYLQRFPVNALKIDRGFISELTAGGENREIISSIVALAKSLNLDVIAEGIELSHQLSDVKEMKCQYAQGHFFSRAMAPKEVEEWINEGNIGAAHPGAQFPPQ
jgi:diguanylate cyclase (GGDEF)-like protein/PAS domain S-box-containing protein